MKPYFAFQWHITDTCDQRCRHCYIFAKEKDITWGILGNPFHLNDEVCKKLYDSGCRKY